VENNFSDVPEDVKRFCQEYVVDLNVQKAMRRANFNEYYTKGGYWLEKPEVQAYVKYLQSNAAETVGISLIRNATELAKIAYGSAANLRSDWMNVKDWDELTDEEKCILSEVKAQTTTTYSKQGDPIITEILHFKTHDKLRAIEMLNKIFGFNQPDQLEVSGKGGAPIVVTGMVIKKE